MEVVLQLRFADPAYRAYWIYRSLSPLLYAVGGLPYRPARIRIAAGELQTTFCLDSDYREGDVLHLSYGTRRLAVDPGPIRWRNGAEPGKQASGGRGTAGPVKLADQPDPDWIMIRSATWSPGEDGLPVVEVEVFNPLPVRVPGIGVSLRFSNASGLGCPLAGVDRKALIEVAVSRGAGLASGPTDAMELQGYIASESSYGVGTCGEVHFEAPLGSTGPLLPRGMTRIRYRFTTPVHEDLVDLPYRYLEFSGAPVSPRSLRIRESGAGNP